MGLSSRILFVDQTAQLGGAELWLRDVVLARSAQDKVYLFQQGPLADALRERNVEVITYEASDSLATLRKNSGLLVKLRSSVSVLRMVRLVAREARNVDAVYANTPKALVVAALAGKRARKPVVYHLHDILSREHFSRSNLALLVGLSNYLVSHVVANSSATEEAYRAAGGRCPTSVSYNGFDAREFAPYVAQRNTYRHRVRDELQLKDDTPIVAVFGRLAPWKGQHVAIEAIRQLPGVHLMLVGDALFGESEYKGQLEALASQPELVGRVHFLGCCREVLSLMQAADFIVHSSTAPEPFGRVIVEAMLSQRPIIAAGAGGAAEIVSHAQTGWLSKPGDAAELAQCIERVRTLSDDHREAILQRAHAEAAKRFSLDAAVAHVEQVVSNLKP